MRIGERHQVFNSATRQASDSRRPEYQPIDPVLELRTCLPEALLYPYSIGMLIWSNLTT